MEEKLLHRLLSDSRKIRLPVNEVEIYLRPYSKTYYGRYFPVYSEEDTPKIYLYPYEKGGNFMPYSEILEILVHEMCHHIQYSDPNFKRIKGVMHDSKFWKLYNHYLNRAERKGIIEYVKEKVG